MTSRAAAGLLGGVLAPCLMKVYRSEKTDRPVSAAGGAYALLWMSSSIIAMSSPDFTRA